MDKKILVEKDIDEGKKLLQALDDDKFIVSSALWFYFPDDGWRLLIASPSMEKDGPKYAYNCIKTTIIKLLPPIDISLQNISVISPNDRLIKLLKAVINTGPGIQGIRFTSNVVNNVFIEDAFIYRLA